MIDLTLGSQFIGCRAVTSASPLSSALLGLSSLRSSDGRRAGSAPLHRGQGVCREETLTEPDRTRSKHTMRV
jgi:hypothetical protein